MYSFVLPKILFQTIHIQNFEEDNREYIHLFSERFSTKQYKSKILEKQLRMYSIVFRKIHYKTIPIRSFEEGRVMSGILGPF